ncbi:MAG: hypothetical protein K6A40_12095 [Solobacterium sp.]|nr:hypothetical protein [Solobacterium sp.]
MKSRKLKTRNIPDTQRTHTINIKPTILLVILLMMGIAQMVMKLYLVFVGLMMTVISIFCIVVMPDRTLVSWDNEYLVLYNRRDRSECMMIAWDEILSWHYEWHPSADLLSVTLIDGSVETQEMYSSRRIRRVMKQHASGKEVRYSGLKRRRI